LSSQMEPTLKKRYGQHFLRDTGILDRIVKLVRPEAADLMVEVGSGGGALSIRLAPKVLRLLAIEIDFDLIPRLRQALRLFPNAEVISADILNVDLPALVAPYLKPDISLRLVGNLPYNIGTAIIEQLLVSAAPIKDMTFMLQLETAERISAAPGSKQYGYFSVFCQHYCEVRMGFKVSPACFVPRPKVFSALLSLRPRTGRNMSGFEDDFLMVTKAAFAYRRKKLANSLKRHSELRHAAEDLLHRAGIDGSRRAEDLSVEEYENLARIHHESRIAG
jgi:16S rRNA (adenine1518-N6/adenine1519-N6)-dimethyltransferase